MPQSEPVKVVTLVVKLVVPESMLEQEVIWKTATHMALANIPVLDMVSSSSLIAAVEAVLEMLQPAVDVALNDAPPMSTVNDAPTNGGV